MRETGSNFTDCYAIGQVANQVVGSLSHGAVPRPPSNYQIDWLPELCTANKYAFPNISFARDERCNVWNGLALYIRRVFNPAADTQTFEEGKENGFMTFDVRFHVEDRVH